MHILLTLVTILFEQTRNIVTDTSYMYFFRYANLKLQKDNLWNFPLSGHCVQL